MEWLSFDGDLALMARHVGAAWLAGGVIGLERSFHGRPAGFRTHALVCLSSALLMVVTSFQRDWAMNVAGGAINVNTDPTRMAQGIMTGIGFLGAGVIFKEGLTVRGLTTAASVWTTAAIGILFGIGLTMPAALATLTVLFTLSVFRWVENHIPSEMYANHVIRFAAGETMPESELRSILKHHGFSVTNISYRLDEGGAIFEYRMTLRTIGRNNLELLAAALREQKGVAEFRIAPSD